MKTARCPQCGLDQPAAPACSRCAASLFAARLEVVSGASAGWVGEVRALPFRIGRGAGNELRLTDLSVSRNHARIVWEGGDLVVEDLGSRMGLFVDGARVKRAALASGSHIQLGEASLRFVDARQGAEPPASVTVDRRGEERQDLLLAVIAAISSSLVESEVLDRIVDAVVRVTRAQRGFLLLAPEPGPEEGASAPAGGDVAGLVLRVARATDGSTPGAAAVRPDVVRKVLDSGLPVVTRLDGEGAGTSGGSERHSVVCLPLSASRRENGGRLGVLYADNPSTWTDLDGDSLRAAEALCRHATLAIHNARLFAREHRVNAELRRARDQAQEASRAKGSFLAVMSHELHTPLNAVIGYGEMCRERAEERQDAWDLVDLGRQLAAARHLLGLVDAVLDASELESGGVKLQPEPVDVRALLTSVVGEVGPAALDNGNTVALDVEEGLGPAWADPRRLRQVLVSLASNAARFTRQGKVRIRAAREAAGGLRVEVADDGPGMTAEQIARVQEPFTQADDSATRRHGGLGLGLAVSRRLCELMGGTLQLESAPGQGCLARVLLPGSSPPTAR